MTKGLTHVEITFENLEYIIIPRRFYKEIMFRGIHVSAYGDGSECPEHKYDVGYIKLSIAKAAEEHISEFEAELYYFTSLAERLAKNDITSIRFHYDEYYLDLHVAWEDEADNEYRNKLQITKDTDDVIEVIIGSAI